MVRTRSKATSPGHQESKDASSHPQRDRQSAPVMPQSSVQHLHSMAAAMAELTRRNQELTREINSKKGMLKVRPKVRKIGETLNQKANRGVPHLEGCHNWRGRWIR